MDTAHKRNFCIAAHIDHGKSTLADCLIKSAHLVQDNKMRPQMLDNMDIERERGITIKSQAVTIPYQCDGESYELNFVDTPGHVDFSYEVGRAMASVEGVILLVDATQGVQSQTVANLYKAMEADCTILPVVNKIDLPSANIEDCRKEIRDELGLDDGLTCLVSAKTGEGVDGLLRSIVKNIPSPRGEPASALRALIFDCNYDNYKGVVVHVRVFDGAMKVGDTITFLGTNQTYRVEEVGIFSVKTNTDSGFTPCKVLEAGSVGYFTANIKTVSDAKVGDTISVEGGQPLPGFKESKPVVFSSIYPMDSDDYEELKAALEKLKLNDASLVYDKDNSVALGNGFRAGFLGLLHLEIVEERLLREFGQSVIFTSPSVRYKAVLTDGTEALIDNPADYPVGRVRSASEPYITASIITPADYLGPIMDLCKRKRGEQTNLVYLDTKRVELTYSMPLSEVLFDFYDTLKSISRGYASLDYEISEYRATDMVKVDVLLNSKPVDALSFLAFRANAVERARKVCERLKGEIARQQFKIAIQAAIGGQIIARETVSPVRKDVTAKCYGGDISRKRKLLEKQKEGKKRMKKFGDVELPQSAFLAVLRDEP